MRSAEIEGSRDAIIGMLPEDCNGGADAVDLQGEVCGVEPTGDAAFLTSNADDALIEVKAARSYRSELGATESVVFDRSRIYFFDAESGRRIR